MNFPQQSRRHLWQGEFIDDLILQEKLAKMGEELSPLLELQIPLATVLNTLHLFSQKLALGTSLHESLLKTLRESTELSDSEAKELLLELAQFLRLDNLKTKVKREYQLPTDNNDPRDFLLIEPSLYEGWGPLGVLAHVAPANALLVGVLSVVEGLLAGNINILKTSRMDPVFSAQVLFELGRLDSSGVLARVLMAVHISSEERDHLQRIFSFSDGIAVWGGEAALRSVAELAPRTARVIDWGPKISFAYFQKEAPGSHRVIGDLEKLAREIILLEQQACSSPQVLYYGTDSKEELLELGQLFAKILSKTIASDRPQLSPAPSPAEWAEITNVTELCRLEEIFGDSKVFDDEDKSYRILLEMNNELKTSPLFRTIWLKPLLPKDFVRTLLPFRSYLQTVGLSADERDVVALSASLLRAGALRVTPLGGMQASYTGEPHDGVYALPRYSKRMSIKTAYPLQGHQSLAALLDGPARIVAESTLALPTMSKEDFQTMKVDEDKSDLFFKSGGSSGEPKLSRFSYDDYHFQMQMAANGLVAAGLDPARDRTMNLFFAGGLYGGFISFFSILEVLRAKQFPMAAHTDLKMVGQTIVQQKVDTLLGMPSYLLGLFQENQDLLAKNQVVKKIFFGGEPFHPSQVKWLKETFGVGLIASATYGSVDAGPLGYQCPQCTDGVHHLHHNLHHLEILKMDRDAMVEEGEVGRLVFTPLVRSGQDFHRYEIGDLGRPVPGPCPCGRRSPRFQLMGRYGDVFKAGGTFLNLQKMVDILDRELSFRGECQALLTLDEDKGRDTLTLLLSAEVNTTLVRETVINSYHDLEETLKEGNLTFQVVLVKAQELQRTPGSGKLKRIIDSRG